MGHGPKDVKLWREAYLIDWEFRRWKIQLKRRNHLTPSAGPLNGEKKSIGKERSDHTKKGEGFQSMPDEPPPKLKGILRKPPEQASWRRSWTICCFYAWADWTILDLFVNCMVLFLVVLTCTRTHNYVSQTHGLLPLPVASRSRHGDAGPLNLAQPQLKSFSFLLAVGVINAIELRYSKIVVGVRFWVSFLPYALAFPSYLRTLLRFGIKSNVVLRESYQFALQSTLI